MNLLEGKRLLVTGVLTRGSIAFEVAREAQEYGAQIVLTGFGRGLLCMNPFRALESRFQNIQTTAISSATSISPSPTLHKTRRREPGAARNSVRPRFEDPFPFRLFGG